MSIFEAVQPDCLVSRRLSYLIDPGALNTVNAEIIAEPQQTGTPSPKWRERLHALRHHTPLIFRMVWESAPKVVDRESGCYALIASLIPLAMLARHRCHHSE